MFKMHLIILILAALTTLLTHAGEAENTDSYTIQRLLISNANNQILLIKHPNGWMTPALRHNKNMTIQQGLMDLAANYGITISPPTFAGMFMFLPDYKHGASFRQYFRARWLKGDVKIPEGAILKAQWFSHQEAHDHLSMPGKIVSAEKDMTMHLINYPETVWGGSYRLWKDEGEIRAMITEEFFAL